MSVSGRRLLGVSLAMVLVVSGTALAALPPGGSFDDDNGNVHEGNIEAIAAEGITRGCNPPDNDLFCPDQSVTRGQMAAFLKRALGLPNASTDYFSDDVGSVFEADINALAESGITRGCNPPDNDLFCPRDEVKRDQMGSFLARALDLSPIVPPPPETTTTTTTTSTKVPGNPGDVVNCSDFDTWAEAQAWFDTYYPHYGDVAKLDGNGDGVACESLPGAP